MTNKELEEIEHENKMEGGGGDVEKLISALRRSRRESSELLEVCKAMLSELRSLEASGGACIPSVHVCERMYQAVEAAVKP